MSIQFSPSEAIVLSLHLQNDIGHQEGKFKEIFSDQAERRRIINKAKTMLNLSRENNIPIIHVAVRFKPDYSNLNPNGTLLSMVKNMGALKEGEWGGDFIKEVKPLEDEIVVTHHRVGPFQDSNLKEEIDKMNRRTLILFGIATNVVVESTARVASDLGYEVIVIEDCCSASTIESHKASIESISLFASIASMEEVSSNFKLKCE